VIWFLVNSLQLVFHFREIDAPVFFRDEGGLQDGLLAGRCSLWIGDLWNRYVTLGIDISYITQLSCLVYPPVQHFKNGSTYSYILEPNQIPRSGT